MSYDLSVSNLAVLPVGTAQRLAPGDSFTFQYTLSVNVRGSVNDDHIGGLYLSRDGRLDAGDVMVGAWRTYIPNGGTFTIKLPNAFGSIPLEQAPGTYHLIVRVDNDNQIAEPNEANNIAVLGNVQIGATDAMLPTAQDVIDTYGRLNLMAKLAQAAYFVRGFERKEDYYNNNDRPTGKASFEELAGHLRPMTADDLPDLGYSALSSPVWGPYGIKGGTYINKNAAAIVMRSSDAVFLSFRGTNDNEESTRGPLARDTPDKKHWLWMKAHADLMDPLIEALKDYVADDANGIKRIYVTGHSLGAGMVEYLMKNHVVKSVVDGATVQTFGGVKVDASTFASPGYVSLNVTFRKLTNLWIDGDAISAAAIAGDNDGDRNVIYHNLPGRVFSSNDLHSIDLYNRFTQFLQENGIGAKELSGKALHGIDYDSIYLAAIYAPRTKVVTVGGTAAIGEQSPLTTIKGANTDDLIIGTDGRDKLVGGLGRDHMMGGDRIDELVGGEGRDFLYGEAGADHLYGGGGQDELTGGAGADTFHFRRADLSTRPHPIIKTDLNDTITDFERGKDRIDLSDFDPRLWIGDQALKFIGTARFTGTDGEVRYRHGGGNTHVEVDATKGEGAAAGFTITLIGEIDLRASDFIL